MVLFQAPPVLVAGGGQAHGHARAGGEVAVAGGPGGRFARSEGGPGGERRAGGDRGVGDPGDLFAQATHFQCQGLVIHVRDSP
ncbi:hypothetical protein ACFRMQ_27290, partial [Kitasatospora sp. NPDC056783]